MQISTKISYSMNVLILKKRICIVSILKQSILITKCVKYMKKQPELLHLVILSVFGMIIGAICKFDNYSDFILAGFLTLILIFSCIHLRKNRPKWITNPFKSKSMNQDEINYRYEAWKRWEENVQTRTFAIVIVSICSFWLGWAIHPFLFSYGRSSGIMGKNFPDTTLIVFSIILLIIIYFFISKFIKKEKDLYNQQHWTKSYIIEKLNQKMLAEELMDGSYQE